MKILAFIQFKCGFYRNQPGGMKQIIWIPFKKRFSLVLWTWHFCVINKCIFRKKFRANMFDEILSILLVLYKICSLFPSSGRIIANSLSIFLHFFAFFWLQISNLTKFCQKFCNLTKFCQIDEIGRQFWEIRMLNYRSGGAQTPRREAIEKHSRLKGSDWK